MTDLEIAQAVRLRKNGMKLNDVARLMNYSRANVSNYTRCYLGKKKKRWTDTEVNKLIRYRKDGISFEKIGMVIGRSKTACRKKYEYMFNKCI